MYTQVKSDLIYNMDHMRISGTKPSSEREYSETKKNHQKLITKRKRKVPYLAQYTKISKVIKRFWTAAFTDLDQWQLVLILSGYVSFIILNMCTM